jgi:hypothetical protein
VLSHENVINTEKFRELLYLNPSAGKKYFHQRNRINLATVTRDIYIAIYIQTVEMVKRYKSKINTIPKVVMSVDDQIPTTPEQQRHFIFKVDNNNKTERNIAL